MKMIKHSHLGPVAVVVAVAFFTACATAPTIQHRPRTAMVAVDQQEDLLARVAATLIEWDYAISASTANAVSTDWKTIGPADRQGAADCGGGGAFGVPRGDRVRINVALQEGRLTVNVHFQRLWDFTAVDGFTVRWARCSSTGTTEDALFGALGISPSGTT